MSPANSTIAISAPRVFDGRQFLRDHCVLLHDEQIGALLPRGELPREAELLELNAGTLAPGFIDLQVNGGGDMLFTAEPEMETIVHMARAHRSMGTTSLMPTIISEVREVHAAAVKAVADAIAAGHSGILGIHLEGPFFNTNRRGAHRADRLRAFAEQDLKWLQSLQQFPVILTLAPEQLQADQIEQLARSGLMLCAGHTDASYEQLHRAAESGLRGVTHLYNAMSPLQSREPGTVGAALAIDSLWAGIIADGHHVHSAAIRIAQRAKPAGKLILVSDAMSTVGGQRDHCELYGESIREVDGKLVNGNGKLAGSAIGMIDAVRYCHEVVDLPLEECLRMASRYPAVIMGRQAQLGLLAPGMRADMVHFDENFTVNHTWLAGEMATH
ncbi:MAG: N-acetylglucosamine-6-phosphate deacetylase [Halioglobus sp.]